MRSFRAGMVLRGCYGRARAWTLSGKKERGKLVLELEFSGIQAVDCLHSIEINWQSVNAGITRAPAPRAFGRSWRRFRWGIFRGIYLHYLSLSISARAIEFGDAIPVHRREDLMSDHGLEDNNVRQSSLLSQIEVCIRACSHPQHRNEDQGSRADS